MSINLGRSIRMMVKNGIVKCISWIINSVPVRKVSGLMLTSYLNKKAMVRGQKLSFIAEVFAVIFDVACIPIEWCLIFPVQKLWAVLKVKWAGAKIHRALPAK